MAEKYSRLGPVVDDWLTADGLILIESWARDGYTIQDIATRIGIVPQTLRAWMNKYDEIKQAVNNGRELVDYKVENALLKAALGYKTKEVRVSTIIRNGKTIETQRETIEREAAPNVAACTTWLYNRQPKKWKNMNAKSNLLEEMDEDTSIQITVVRAGQNECKQSAPSSGASSFEEVDTDWQNDVNQSVTIRPATEEERKAKQKQKEAEAEPEEDVTVEYENDVEKVSKRTTPPMRNRRKKAKSNSADNASKRHAPVATKSIDIDAWPDDWEDD